MIKSATTCRPSGILSVIVHLASSVSKFPDSFDAAYREFVTKLKLPDISTSGRWARLRTWAGYALFAGILAWALADAPHILWHANPIWLLAVVPFILLNLLFQVIQTRIFLHNRGVENPGWRIPIHFTLKKSDPVSPAVERNMAFVKNTLFRMHLASVFHSRWVVCHLSIRIAIVGLLLWGMEAGMFFSRRKDRPPRE